jgi:hypothetical protein
MIKLKHRVAEGSGSWHLTDHIPPPHPAGLQRYNRVAALATMPSMAMTAYLGSATDVELFQIMYEAAN